MNKKLPLILLIEDEPAIVKLVEFKVKGSGFPFEYRSNGKDGYDAIKELNPAVVVLDVMLPSMNGFEILRKIREDDNNKELKVVMLTSKSRVEDLKQGFDLEADDYIEKPFRPDELLMRIRKVLS